MVERTGDSNPGIRLTDAEWAKRLEEVIHWHREKLGQAYKERRSSRARETSAASDALGAAPYCVSVTYHYCFRNYADPHDPPTCYDDPPRYVTVLASDEQDAASKGDDWAWDNMPAGTDICVWDIVPRPGAC